MASFAGGLWRAPLASHPKERDARLAGAQAALAAQLRLERAAPSELFTVWLPGNSDLSGQRRRCWERGAPSRLTDEPRRRHSFGFCGRASEVGRKGGAEKVRPPPFRRFCFCAGKLVRISEVLSSLISGVPLTLYD